MADTSGLDPTQGSVFNSLTTWLQQIGLNTGTMQDFIKNAIINSDSTDTIKLNIVNQPDFQKAFPEYQAAIKAGNPMSPADILNYRTTVTGLMKDAGLPSGFYDQPDDFVNLISNNLSPAELQSRIQDGYAKVAQAPQAVKDAFSDYFGAQGDNMLATFFLDPTKGTDAIQKAVQTASIGGQAAQAGLGITQGEAANVAAQGFSEYTLRSGIQQAAQQGQLANESISESNDLTGGDVLNQALGIAGTQAVARRQQERSAAFGGGGGGAAQTREGLGLGTSNP
jgi:hypothetical protein